MRSRFQYGGALVSVGHNLLIKIRFYRYFAGMTLDPIKWNKRASVVYAVGIWTMFGCYGYYRYTHRNDPPVELPVEEEDNRPNVKKYETKHSKTTIVYRENFVPYSTRLLNLFGSTNESSPESQNQEERK